MLTRRYKYLARFGLMHMVATNIVVWFSEVVKETLRELRQMDEQMDKNVSINLLTGRMSTDWLKASCFGR